MNRNTVSCSALLSRLGRLCALAVAGLFAATATANPYLTFSSAQSFTITPQTNSWDGQLQYSTDAQTWVAFTTNGATAANSAGTYRLHLRGTDNSRISPRPAPMTPPAWSLTAAGAVACSGNIETLLDYTVVAAGQHPPMGDYCFARLFEGWTALTQAPSLPATTLADGCYYYMFLGCTGLAQAPALPATTLAVNCYRSMFLGCTGLAQAPALPATTLAGCCYDSMFRYCTGLTQAPELPATTLAEFCYSAMFFGCTGLTQTPALPATTLAHYCYGAMFLGCTGLTLVPELPATALADSCYQGMFQNCTGIKLGTQGPGTEWRIPANAAAQTSWNSDMFRGTGGIFTGDPVIGTTYYHHAFPPYLAFSSADTFTITPQTNSWDGQLQYSTDAQTWAAFTTAGATAANSSGTYRLYIRGTGNTRIAPANGGVSIWTLDAAGTVACEGNIETLLDHAAVAAGQHPPMADYCFACLFDGWTALTQAPILPATTLAQACYRFMFRDCTGLAQAPELPATTMAEYCYHSMFGGCTGLTQAPALPATTLATGCYSGMFQGCTGLTQAPALPATTLATGCYSGMFQGCTGLTQAPALPATTLVQDCYSQMFNKCTGLTQAPELPATTLDASCYALMFRGCTGLTQAPELPATTLAHGCYDRMFEGCTGLTQAPALPATTLAHGCYLTMFLSCTGLAQAPALPATTLTNHCYSGMFQGCTGLTQAPALPATALADYCYYQMFKGCTGIRLHAQGPGPAWGIPAGASAAPGWNTDMLAGTGGTFTGNPVIGTTYYHAFPPYLAFSSAQSFTITPQTNSWNGTLEYSTDKQTWAAFGTAGAAAAADGSGTYKLYLRGTNNSQIATSSTTPGWTLTAAGTVACSGNIETLLDYTAVAAGQHPPMGNYCFARLFKGWTALTEAPALPATTLAGYCYHSMFMDCTALTEAPALPAMTMDTLCYYFMFRGCTGLTQAPALPATALADHCYHEMFRDCTGLAQAPALPATALAVSCYYGMFSGCTGLAQAPALPATTLGVYCYQSMFRDCTGLAQAPALPATALAGSCYRGMFEGCTGLAQAPALPATTLAPDCYYGMFSKCTGLTQVPALPATTLVTGCYAYMFRNCSGIKLGTTGPGAEWSIPSSATATATDWNSGMFMGTGGTFTGNPVIGTTYYHALPPCLTFSSARSFSITPPRKTWGGTIEYSTDAQTWAAFGTAGAAAATDGSGTYKLYLRGTNNSQITTFSHDAGWTLTADGTVACSGNIETLLDYTAVAAGQHPAMDSSCFAFLFYRWEKLTQAPELPATALANRCYYQMLRGCTRLTSAPALPATTLAPDCYYGMFWNCTRLAQAPALPATALADHCYFQMFKGCTGLAQAPALQATALATACYFEMFLDCTGLAQAPALPATTLASSCYYQMFKNCTGLAQAPALPATALAADCYYGMFWNCTGLTQAPALPATTLATQCYAHMFQGCTGIKLHATGSAPTWGIPSAAVATATDWNYNMLAGTGGTFTGNPEIGVVYYYTPAPDPDPEAPVITAITVNTGASTLAITVGNVKKDVWYTLLVADELGDPWTAVNPSVKAAADGIHVFQNVPATEPRRFYKVRASATQP